jgi:hypothetical protein
LEILGGCKWGRHWGCGCWWYLVVEVFAQALLWFSLAGEVECF